MADGGETLLGGKDAVPASSCPALPAEAELLAALGISAADLDIARQVPKVELHCHLDGSLSEAFVQRQMQRRLPGSRMLSPTADLGFATCQAWIHACKSDVPWSGKLMPEGMVGVRGEGNTGPMDIFNWANQWLQTADDLEEATLDLAVRMRDNHNVLHLEVRFCPTLHTLHGLSERAACDAVSRGFNRAGMSGGVIICALRTLPPSHWAAMVKLTAETAAVGIDVAGYEPGSPLSPEMLALLARAKAAGCGVTVHAGEWPGARDAATGEVETLQNVRRAVESGIVDRIGHGLQLAGQDELLVAARRSGMHIECQPFSNGALLQDLTAHPVKEFLGHGLSVSLSTDNVMFAGQAGRHHDDGPSLQLAYTKSQIGLSWGQIAALTAGACDHVFGADQAKKVALRATIEQGFAKVLGSHAS